MKHCLIVDDSRVIRKVSRHIVESFEFEVTEAENGQDALAKCEEGMPDLILLDWNMPVMNGYEVAQTLRAHHAWRAVPLVAVTAFSMPGDREKALEVGFDEHLSKPIVPETFVRQVEAFLGSSFHAPPAAA